jgi:hypothetical protein
VTRIDGVVASVLGLALTSAFCLAPLAAAPPDRSPKPQYDAKGLLLRPADYRDWEFLSAGYGMLIREVHASVKRSQGS